MYRIQIALVFSDFGFNHLYEKFKVPLEVHGLLDDPDTSEIMEGFLSMYDFDSPVLPLFDEFIIHYRIYKQMIKYNRDLPIQYINLYKPSEGISH